MMLGRHVYRVHPTEQGWTVTKEGEHHPRGGYPGREEAIAEAVRLAESDTPAKVTVDNGDGTLAEEWLFGSDPAAELGASLTTIPTGGCRTPPPGPRRERCMLSAGTT